MSEEPAEETTAVPPQPDGQAGNEQSLGAIPNPNAPLDRRLNATEYLPDTSTADEIVQPSYDVDPANPAEYDALTGLPGRRLFTAALERAVTEKPGETVMLMMDVNGLKRVNDEQGHLAGDRFIQQAATALRGYVRQHDMLARLGGDEFAVLMEGITSATEAHLLATRLQQVLGEAGVSIAIGSAKHAPSETADELYQRVDEYMYENKGKRKLGQYGREQLEAAVQIDQIAADNGIDLAELVGVISYLHKRQLAKDGDQTT